MGKPIITVVGSINMDLVIQCNKIPVVGQTVLANSVAEHCGGKGANQAVAAARAGGQVAIVGRVGDDAFADRLIENLHHNAVDTRFVWPSPKTASGLAVIAVEISGQNSILVVPGANARLSTDDVRAARSLITTSDVLLVQLESPMDTVIAAVQMARDAGIRVILDPAPAPTRLDDRLYHVDLLCPNESEAEALVGHEVRTPTQAERAAQTLHDRGAASVAITMGGQGTFLLHEQQTQLIPAFKIDAVDTTAAGDAFAGAVAVHWAQHNDLDNDLFSAVRFANAAGGLAASRHGAQTSMPTRIEIDDFWMKQ